jgi:transposase
MPRKTYTLAITERQKDKLIQLVNRPKTEQHLAKRGKILLLTLEGRGRRSIGQELNVSDTTVVLWRKRWVENNETLGLFEEEIGSGKRADKALMSRIVNILTDYPRPGTPAKFTEDQVKQIVALACQKPEDVGLPISDWTHEVLAREAAKRGIVESISTTRVFEILKKYSPPSP